MGRKKITIQPILHPSTRRATFEKRRIGLLKKAAELSILCKSTVSLTIYTSEGDVYVYSSEPFENVITKFNNYRGPYRLLTNDHLAQLVPGKSSSSSVGFVIIKQPQNAVPPPQHMDEMVMPVIGAGHQLNSLSDTLTNSPDSELREHSSKKRRTSSNSVSSSSSLNFGQLNMQHPPPYPHAPPPMYGVPASRGYHPTGMGMGMGLGMGMGFPPHAQMYNEPPHAHAPWIAETAENMHITESASDEVSLEKKVVGDKRSFKQMTHDDLMPDFDDSGAFDAHPELTIPNLHDNLSSSFL